MAMTDKEIRPGSPDGIYRATNGSIRDIEIQNVSRVIEAQQF